jgi:hypothetical protein
LVGYRTVLLKLIEVLKLGLVKGEKNMLKLAPERKENSRNNNLLFYQMM